MDYQNVKTHLNLSSELQKKMHVDVRVFTIFHQFIFVINNNAQYKTIDEV